MINFPKSKAQKHQIGDVCRLDGEDTLCIVLYSYYQRYGCGNNNHYCVYLIKEKEEFSWVFGKDLIYKRNCTEKEEQIVLKHMLRVDD